MRALGIDLSSQNAGTAACLLRFDDGRGSMESLDSAASDETLKSRVAESDITGLDCPFGWPTALAGALSGWAQEGRWEYRTQAAATTALELRLTDHTVWKATKKRPLSASASGLGYTAWRACTLLSDLAADAPVDRVYGRVREVYPGAALLRWKLIDPDEPLSYKKSERVRQALLEQICERAAWLDLTDADRVALCKTDHRFDALVCALIARAVERLQCEPAPDDPRIACEGWIWLPLPNSLPRLGS